MIYEEKKTLRNGETLPIECLHMHLNTQSSLPGHLHYHDYTELLFGLGGTALVFIGTEHVDLCPGTLVVIQAGDAHEVICPAPPCNYIVIKFLPKLLISAEQTGAEFDYALTLMEQSANRQSIFHPEELEGTDIPNILHRMMDEWNGRQFGYELSLRADVTRVILFLLRRWQQATPWLRRGTQSADREIMRVALAYIGSHYADLCERDVAQACGISPVAVSRLFARTMKCSFPDYVCGVRLREAERLLLTTDLSVTDIALQVGFSTSAYFIAKFRQSKGTTPYRFRRSGATAKRE